MAALMVLSVVAIGGAAFAGSAAAAHYEGPDDEFTTTEIDGEPDVYFGQEVEITEDQSDEGEEDEFEGTVRVKEGIPGDDGEIVKNVRLGDDAENITFDIDEDTFSEGPYYLVDSAAGQADEDGYGPFWVNEQEIDTEWDSDDVNIGSEATLEYEDVSDQPRDEVDLYVSAEDDDGEAVSADDLNNTFGDAADTMEDVDDAVVIEGVSDEDELDATFDGWAEGDYTFTVDVADTTAEDTADITVGEAPDIATSFDADDYEGVAGDEVEFTVELEGADEAEVMIMDDDGEFYTANLTVEDGSGSDNVTVVMNTYLAGQDDDDAFTAADEDDIVTIDDDESLAGFDEEPRLPAEIYEMQVFPEGEDDEDDIAFLTLEEGEIGDLNTWITTEGDYDELDDLLENAVERNTVAEDDYLIFQVEASGVFGYLTDGDNISDDEGLEMTFEDTVEPRFGAADSFNVNEAIEDGDAQIFQDADNGMFFVELDPSDTDIDVDETWDVSFTVDEEENAYFTDDVEIDDEFSVEERTVELEGDFEDDVLQVEQSDEAEIAGTTNVAPGGDDADFRLRFAETVMRGSADVSEDGTFATTFDLSDRAVDDEFTVRTQLAGEEITDDAVVVEGDVEDDEEEAAFVGSVATDPAEPVDGDDVTVMIDIENEGDADGDAAVEFVFAGDTLVDEDVSIEAGDTASLEEVVEEAPAGDYEWELIIDGETEIEDTLTVAEPEEDDDDAPEEDDDDAPEEDDDDEPVDDDDDEPVDDDDDGQPGFGVAVALAALLGAAMLALRRQD